MSPIIYGFKDGTLVSEIHLMCLWFGLASLSNTGAVTLIHFNSDRVVEEVMHGDNLQRACNFQNKTYKLHCIYLEYDN